MGSATKEEEERGGSGGSQGPFLSLLRVQLQLKASLSAALASFPVSACRGPRLLDTNFINMSIQMKLDIFKSAMECLLAKCVPCITDCRPTVGFASTSRSLYIIYGR